MIGDVMKNVGRRLREERLRLDKKIEEFAELSGIHENSIGNYERGDRAPNVALLLVWQDLGIDIAYVLTGERGGELGFGQSELLRMYEMLSHRERDAVMALLMHLSGSTISLPELGSSKTVHDRRPEYRAGPKGS